VGASQRTLARLFPRDTGLPFGRWRTRARISAAPPLLAAGELVGRVALRVGYLNASAFVAAFRQGPG
jgi:AraC-like DNA-binding protein